MTKAKPQPLPWKLGPGGHLQDRDGDWIKTAGRTFVAKANCALIIEAVNRGYYATPSITELLGMEIS